MASYRWIGAWAFVPFVAVLILGLVVPARLDKRAVPRELLRVFSDNTWA